MAVIYDHESSESAQYPAQFTVISFPQSAAEIETETQVLLGQMEEGFQAIIDAEPQTFENCILPYDRLSYLGFRYFSVLSELLSVSPSPEVQAAAMAATSATGGISDRDQAESTVAGGSGIILPKY